MDSIRLAPADSVFPVVPCCRCGQGKRYWDRIAGKSYCPDCLEALAMGEADPLTEKTDRRRCTICNQPGSVRYLTFPLQSRRPVEMDVCAEHLRGLVARRLGAHAFEQLRRQLRTLKIDVGEIFLLHDAFYDSAGKARQPAIDWF